jgi:predicted acylesterase/phospholipase RssA
VQYFSFSDWSSYSPEYQNSENSTFQMVETNGYNCNPMDITVALGGGGARGAAHIGVLRVLERSGFRIRAIAGTSIGSLVAALYASGRSPAQIEEIFSAVDQSKLSQGPTWRYYI